MSRSVVTPTSDAGGHELVRRARPPRDPHARQGDHRLRGRDDHLRRDGRRGPRRWPAACTERGVGRGEVVGLLSYNCPEFLETVFAANYLGAIAMPINWRLAAPEVRYILEHSEARALVCDESLVDLAERGDDGHGGHARAGLRLARRLRRVDDARRPARRLRAAVRRGRDRGRRRPPADVHVGHHRTPQGRDAHPRQPGVEEPRAHRRVRLHQRRSRARLRAALPRRRARPHDHLADRRRRDDDHPPGVRRRRRRRRARAIAGDAPCGWRPRWSTRSWRCPTSSSATCRRCG